MLKCPLCGFENEDGSLFCDECKTDLSAVQKPLSVDVEPGFLPLDPVPVADIFDMPMPVDVGPVASFEPVVEPFPVAEVISTEPGKGTEAPKHEAVAEHVPEPVAPVSMTPTSPPLATGSQPKLIVIRGQKINAEYPIYPELNFIGRSDEKSVDIDLEDQEPSDRVWSSRQHALIHFDEQNGALTIEDLNSSNGTYVNRNRVHPGTKQPLNANDVIQVGTVHMRVKV